MRDPTARARARQLDDRRSDPLYVVLSNDEQRYHLLTSDELGGIPQLAIVAAISPSWG